METKTLAQTLKGKKIVSPPYFGGGDESLIKWIKANLKPNEVVFFLHPPKGSSIIESEGGEASIYFSDGSKQVFEDVAKSEYKRLYIKYEKYKQRY